jgi:hypothetical protein
MGWSPVLYLTRDLLHRFLDLSAALQSSLFHSILAIRFSIFHPCHWFIKNRICFQQTEKNGRRASTNKIKILDKHQIKVSPTPLEYTNKKTNS